MDYERKRQIEHLKDLINLYNSKYPNGKAKPFIDYWQKKIEAVERGAE